MIGQYGETLVIDWGLAKPVGRHFETNIQHVAETLNPASASGSPETVAGSVIGTPQYMSPEQASGAHDRVEASSDIYGLGATLYFLLTGVPPFNGKTAHVLKMVVRGEFTGPTETNRDVPKALAAICLKAMSLKPADRYSSADLLASDIERWMADEPVIAMPDTIVDRISRWSRHHKSVVTAVGVMLLIIPAASVIVSIQRERRISAESARNRAEAEKQLADEKALASQKLSTLQEYHALTAQPSVVERARPGWTWNRLSKLTKAAALDAPQRDQVYLRSEIADTLTSVDVREASTAMQHLLVLESPAPPLPIHPEVSRLAFSSDGQFLALGQKKTTNKVQYQVRIVDLERGTARSLWVEPDISRYEEIRALKFTPNNRGLVIATRYGCLHYWDLSRPDEKPTKSWKGHDERIFGLVVSPDGQWLFSADDKKLKRWDLNSVTSRIPESVTREVGDNPNDRFLEITALPNRSSFICTTVSGIQVIDYESPNRNVKQFLHDGGIGPIDVAPNGWAFAAGMSNKVSLFDIEQGLGIRSFHDPDLQPGEAHHSADLILRFSHSGALLLSSSTSEHDQVVKLWEVSTGRLVMNIPLDGAVHDAVFSPDGQWLVIATTEKTSIFEIGNIAFQTTVAHQIRPISAIEVDSNGQKLMCAGESRTPQGQSCEADLSLWEIATWQRTNHYEVLGRARAGDTDACSCIAFQPQGNLFAASWPLDNQILVFNSREDGDPMAIEAERPERLAFSLEGRRLWAASGEMVRQWSAEDWKQHPGWSNVAARVFTGANEITCLSVGKDCIFAGARDGKVRRISESKNPQFMGIWPCFSGSVTSISVDPAKEIIFVGGQNGEVAVFRFSSSDPVGRIENAHQGTVNSISGSPDGRLFASASNDRTIKLWRVTESLLEELITLRSSARPIHSVRFSQDGTRLYSAAYGETAIRVWELPELHTALKPLQLDWE